MNKLLPQDMFFAIFLVSILITRVFLFIYPIHSPILWDFHMHHYMYGIILIALGIEARSVVLYGMGAGLFADEALLLHNLTSKGFEGYFAPIALLDVLIVIAAVYFARRYLLIPFHKKHWR